VYDTFDDFFSANGHDGWSPAVDPWPPAVGAADAAAGESRTGATSLIDDLPQAVASLLAAWDQHRDVARRAMTERPLESLLALTGLGAAAYYLAERGRNDKVNTYWDALEYVSTCASVGYSNIFPNTPIGKLVATTLFLLGPTLAARALDERRPT
jgi:hypothetical protein